MKPFDLELAKQNHPIQTRDGKSARIICYDADNKAHPLVVLVKDPYHNTEVPELYTVEGKLRQTLEDNDTDLMMAPTPYKGWISLYRDGKRVYGGQVYDTEEEALENKSPGAIVTKEIEWEE